MIILENPQLKVTIAEMGAELTSILDKELNRECLWTADPAIWGRHAPLLFPVVGSCRGKEYRYRGQTYAMPQHGFAKEYAFEALKTSESTAVFTLRSDEEKRIRFPFDWTLTVIYSLAGRELTVGWKVVNDDADSPLFFSIGGHPGFLFDGPLENQIFEFNSQEDLDRLTLNLQAGLFSREIDKDYVKGGEPIAVTPHIFDSDALVFHDFEFTRISLINKNTRHGVIMDLAGFPYVGLWSKPGAPYACIEPWFGLADYDDFFGEISAKDGIQTLGPGETFEAAYSLEFC
ncbi:MAG: aldose 1-epimerase family protein [Lachnospiraceae bacterium]|nr:aldose 1-epimerase family protein [Lachnospiraceae bacterium]